MADIMKIVRAAADKRILYSLHALDEMNAPDELITKEEVRNVVYHGDLLEEYPEDKRGHSCLLMKITGAKRPVHVVCAPKDDYLAIITAYVPTLDRWDESYRVRRK